MSFLEKCVQESQNVFVIIYVCLYGQWRLEDISHLLRPNLFQNQIRTSIKHEHLKGLSTDVSYFFLIYSMFFAVVISILTKHSRNKPYL